MLVSPAFACAPGLRRGVIIPLFSRHERIFSVLGFFIAVASTRSFPAVWGVGPGPFRVGIIRRNSLGRYNLLVP